MTADLMLVLNSLSAALDRAIDCLDDDNDPGGDALGAFRDAQDAIEVLRSGS